MRDIKILPPVVADIHDAATWYDENGYTGLGERFIQSFYTSLFHIQKHGEIHRLSYKDFRRILIPAFPYFIYYTLHSNTWIVPLVIHAARRPALAKTLLTQRAETD